MDLKNPTRTEALLANIAGYTGVPVPDMKNATRSEILLKEILDNGGGGGGDVTKEYVDNAIADAVTAIDEDISDITDAVENKVDKISGKSLSTNDYTDANKALVQDSPITVTATASPISTANGKPRKLTIYGKSEIVDGAIKSAGEGWSTVRLADLTWNYNPTGRYFYADPTIISAPAKPLCNSYNTKLIISWTEMDSDKLLGLYPLTNYTAIRVNDFAFSDVETFVASLGDTTICYELADPSQGNCIAIKTDNGTGKNGTMATFTTGTPLYGIDENTRDVMTWNGSAGEVTKNCGVVDLGTRTWYAVDGQNNVFRCIIPNIKIPTTTEERVNTVLCARYARALIPTYGDITNGEYFSYNGYFIIKDTDYTDATAFKTAMNGVMLVYELATPTTTPLTQTENESLASLRTYSPQTTITINDNPDYSIEAYANTANGQAISDMQPTRSPLLTLSASGWTNNAQTVTYEHNTGKRNSIDVEPASIKAWTAAGILATSETASTITFECDTVPTSDLMFRVTSMEVR